MTDSPVSTIPDDRPLTEAAQANDYSLETHGVYDASRVGETATITLKVPNSATLEVFRETDAGVNLHEASGVEELIRDLDADQ